MDELSMERTVEIMSGITNNLSFDHLSMGFDPKLKKQRTSAGSSHKYQGFCLNPHCFRTMPKNPVIYQINAAKKNIYTSIYATLNKDEHSCRHCQHALFWTKFWVEIK